MCCAVLSLCSERSSARALSLCSLEVTALGMLCKHKWVKHGCGKQNEVHLPLAGKCSEGKFLEVNFKANFLCNVFNGHSRPGPVCGFVGGVDGWCACFALQTHTHTPPIHLAMHSDQAPLANQSKTCSKGCENLVKSCLSHCMWSSSQPLGAFSLNAINAATSLGDGYGKSVVLYAKDVTIL